MYLPLHLSAAPSESVHAARATVQRLFITHPVRLVIGSSASPVKTWAALMALECARPGRPQPAPYLPRMKTLSLGDTILYHTHKEKTVAAY